MDSLTNIIVSFIIYLSIPLLIRYIILRRPINSRLAAFLILIPLFVIFSIGINVIREEKQKGISEQVGIPYKSTPHMIGSPLLYASMIASYFILRNRRKETNEKWTPYNYSRQQSYKSTKELDLSREANVRDVHKYQEEEIRQRQAIDKKISSQQRDFDKSMKSFLVLASSMDDHEIEVAIARMEDMLIERYPRPQDDINFRLSVLQAYYRLRKDKIIKQSKASRLAQYVGSISDGELGEHLIDHVSSFVFPTTPVVRENDFKTEASLISIIKRFC